MLDEKNVAATSALPKFRKASGELMAKAKSKDTSAMAASGGMIRLIRRS